MVVAGPTASGKTAFALELAQRFHTEIISADSRQVYREMEIGTAKPSRIQLQQVPHHFINSHSILDNYNAGLFAGSCRQLLDELFRHHAVVIMAGGSGLYIDALLNGMDDLPPADLKTRHAIQAGFAEHGISYLQNQLRELDPVTWQRIDRSNPRRMMRALEVCLVSDKAYSSFLTGSRRPFPYESLYLCLDIPRSVLYARIDERVDEMIRDGLVEEVKNLLPFRDHPAMQTVGYKELAAYHEGKSSLESSIAAIKQHTRNYAKRQETWFRRHPDRIPVKPGDAVMMGERISRLLEEDHSGSDEIPGG